MLYYRYTLMFSLVLQHCCYYMVLCVILFACLMAFVCQEIKGSLTYLLLYGLNCFSSKVDFEIIRFCGYTISDETF